MDRVISEVGLIKDRLHVELFARSRRSEEIGRVCDEVIAANPGPVADYRSGKAAAINFLKGQVMKLSKGKANPAVVGDLLAKKLSSD